MSKPRVFIGSSSEGRQVARAIGSWLDRDKCAETKVWDEEVFDYNRGYLEELMMELDKYDFAIMVMTPDDIVESRDQSKAAPRDNVVFECGLFMGRIGRERTFIVCDSRIEMKLPSDLAGVTLASYDGERVASESASAIRDVGTRISKAIRSPEFYKLSGEWVTRYRFCYENEAPPLEEDVLIKPSGGMLCIESKKNPKGDNYEAYGRLVMDKHFSGHWKSTRPTATAGGVFFLTLHPLGNLMYGYYASPDEDYSLIHGSWVMAKKNGESEETLKALLDKGDEILAKTSGFLFQYLNLRQSQATALTPVAPCAKKNGEPAPGVAVINN